VQREGDRRVVSFAKSPCVWATRVASRMAVGDRRLQQRAYRVFSDLAREPSVSILRASETWASAKGAYRMMANERVTEEALSEASVSTTASLCAVEKTVVVVQDTSTIVPSRGETMEGLGPLNDRDIAGLFLHPALALREDGVALGLLHLQMWSREFGQEGTRCRRHERDFEDKESSKWLKGAREARQAVDGEQGTESGPRLIHVFDREGDIHCVFAGIVDQGDGFVVRQGHDRKVADEACRARERVSAGPCLGETTIDVPRKQGQKARQAALELRSTQVSIRINKKMRAREASLREPLTLWLVEAREVDAGKDVREPLRWYLWTTEEVGDEAAALRVLQMYCLRWRIEDLFYTLKSGCRIEQLQFETAERLRKAIAIYTAIAVRILQLRDLGRMEAESPCTVILTEREWRVLWTYIKKSPPPARARPPTLKQAVLWIGRLGGHMNRKGDGMPGVKTLWLGWRDLQRFVQFAERASFG
jgi:hypothetical protein